MATARRYPEEGRTQYLRQLDGADYVEYEDFAEDKGGYCCGTCRVYQANQAPQGTPLIDAGEAEGSYASGWCAGLKAPVRSYGCCNGWSMAPAELIGYDGELL